MSPWTCTRTRSSLPPTFAALVQAFFTEYLTGQRALSPRTVAAYRDAFMLLLDFATTHCAKPPAAMKLTDLTPELILAFLDHLEQERHNTVRSRNARLAALRAFLKFAARRDLSALSVIERSLGVPMKRFERPLLGFLSREEMLAVIGTSGSSWTSQRDHLLLGLLYNTGARVSEIIGVRVADVILDGAACVHLHGKGHKQPRASRCRSEGRGTDDPWRQVRQGSPRPIACLDLQSARRLHHQARPSLGRSSSVLLLVRLQPGYSIGWR